MTILLYSTVRRCFVQDMLHLHKDSHQQQPALLHSILLYGALGAVAVIRLAFTQQVSRSGLESALRTLLGCMLAHMLGHLLLQWTSKAQDSTKG